MKRRAKINQDVRQSVAEAIIVWFDGFSDINDDLKPSTATWKDYSPIEQMRALKAAEAAIEALERAK